MPTQTDMPLAATQEDYERLVDEYANYFELGDDFSIKINLDKNVEQEINDLKVQAYEEYVEQGISRYDASGNDYNDINTWLDTEVVNEIDLNQISNEDRALLEQYNEFLESFNDLLKDGLFVAVVEDEIIKYDIADNVEQSKSLNQRSVSNFFNGRNSFDMTLLCPKSSISIWYEMVLSSCLELL
ncbi:MAG: hypothetical protein LBU60_06395 [Clostridiales bacterium]|nr:hypothetical protein [Clostridiales bacterium]